VDELLPSAIECPADGGIRQTEIQTAEPFVPEPSISEVEIAIGKLKRFKSPGADQIPDKLVQAAGGGGVWNKELPHQWKESIVTPIHKKVIKLIGH
jgi:hypothetical protein